ncbi:hypothetical protein D5018_00115 [Parashewanella curva]|uniref:Lipoprotein n=1 Tax=Parashewanella curva TaxID=2338552 RepID=A0A3L8Q348_9GAMM|nr:hypothetical protein [Parashewanella curva]RLV61559.1 hypothetical protein D5018_00115 [Parashewanella curva]
MKLTNYLLCTALPFTLVGCGGSNDNKTDPVVIDKPKPDDEVKQAPKQLLPTAITQVPAKKQDSPQGVSASFEQPETDYAKLEPNILGAKLAGDEAFQITNFILCFAGQLVPQENINQGIYTALVDQAECNKQSGMQSDESQQSLTKVTTQTTSNDDGSFLVNAVWSSGGEFRIRFEVAAPVSDDSPSGSFKMYMVNDVPEAPQPNRGYLEMTPDASNVRIKYADNVGGSKQMVGLQALNGTSGGSLFHFNGQQVSKIEFNSNLVNAIAGDDTQCLSRDNPSEDALGYGLFKKGSGDLVKLEPGLSFSYSDNGEPKRGHIGKQYQWFEGEQPVSGTEVNGDDDKVYTLTLNEQTGKFSVQNEQGENKSFDDVMVFENVDLSGQNDRAGVPMPVEPQTLVYSGMGSMGQFSGEGNNVEFSFDDGHELSKEIDGEVQPFVVKASRIQQKLKAATDSDACQAIEGSGLTADDFVVIDDELDNFPTAEVLEPSSAAPKYIRGELTSN